MKKLLAVILGLILIMLSVTGCARPDPHYVTEEDFEVEFYPVSDEGQTFASGLTALQIVMNTPNARATSAPLTSRRWSCPQAATPTRTDSASALPVHITSTWRGYSRGLR